MFPTQIRHFSSISSNIIPIRLYSRFFVSFALGFPICWLSMNLPTCFTSMLRLVEKITPNMVFFICPLRDIGGSTYGISSGSY